MTASDREGTSLGGYRLVRLLGRGGMGAVYEALDASGRAVAVKVLAREITTEPETIARFEREATGAAKVLHPHVVRVHALGRDARTGELFMVHELVRGGSLETRLERTGPLPWREAATLGAQVARGLEAIHAAGIVHRDLKPANVLVDEEGRAKVADFGLARSSDDEARLTRTGEVVGTLEFMAPEQLEGSRGAGPAVDLYALGATLHALVSGRPPFRGSMAQLAHAHVTKTPPSLSSLVSDVPAELDALVLELLAKDPRERPAAGDAARRLEAIARGPEGRASGRGILVGLGAAAVALAVIAGGAFVATRGPSVRAEIAALPSPSPTPSPRPSPSPTPMPSPTATPSAPPEWYTKSPVERRPRFPLPPDLAFGHDAGEYVNVKDGSVLVFVPGGKFTMGSEEVIRRVADIHTRAPSDAGDVVPPHERTVDVPAFFIGKYEVRFREFERFVGDVPGAVGASTIGRIYGSNHWGDPSRVSFRDPDGSGVVPRPEEPVCQVSFDEAKAYCDWAGLVLPTEAQWEKAAVWDPVSRKSRLYPWGDERPGQGTPLYANVRDLSFVRDWMFIGFADESADRFFRGYKDDEVRRAPVGSYPAGKSPCGALDMLGNVTEWCLADENATAFPFRGGSWCSYTWYDWPAISMSLDRSDRRNDLGFRVARRYP